MLAAAAHSLARPGFARRAAARPAGRISARVGPVRVVAKSVTSAKGVPPWALRRREGKEETFYELEGEGGKVLIGREGAEQNCNVEIDEGTVSGRHCEITLGKKQCVIRDFNSTNGTSINGRLLNKGGQTTLKEGDRIKLGSVVLDLVILDDDYESEDEEDDDEKNSGEDAAESSSEDEDEESDDDEDDKREESPVGAPRLRKKAASLDPKDIKLGRKIGVGSFGSVFLGEWRGEDVILKQANRSVENAEDLLVLELLLNERAAKLAPRACADFLGAARVDGASAGNVYNGKLQEGLWLAWRYQGYRTLSFYLSRPTMAQELLEIFGITATKMKPEERNRVAVVMVMRQLLEALQRLHKIGMVHRDVKPANILLADADDTKQIIRLIDLGGAALCLGEPLAYAAGLGSFDPLYAPPEQFLLPEGAPAPNFVTTRVLWVKYAPELFDTYCVGMVLLQLALPKLRTDYGLRQFRAQLTQVDYDLSRWREEYASSTKDETVLSAEDGLGWELAERLLTAERVPKGGRKKGKGRMTAAEALAHPFLSL